MTVPQDKQFVFLTTLYEGVPDDRLMEFKLCFEKNYSNRYIKEIHVFFETDKDIKELWEYIDENYSSIYDLLRRDKFTLIATPKRLTYHDYFKYANEAIPNSKIIVSNTDIYMNDTLSHLVDYDIKDKLLSLTRWSESDDGNVYLLSFCNNYYPWLKLSSDEMIPIYHCKKMTNDYFTLDNCHPMCKCITGIDMRTRHRTHRVRNEYSQDTWIFSTPFHHYKNFECDYELGRFGCDTKLNINTTKYSCANPEFKVLNPCLTIQCIHIDKLSNKKKKAHFYGLNPIPFTKDESKNLKQIGFIPWTKLY